MRAGWVVSVDARRTVTYVVRYFGSYSETAFLP